VNGRSFEPSPTCPYGEDCLSRHRSRNGAGGCDAHETATTVDVSLQEIPAKVQSTIDSISRELHERGPHREPAPADPTATDQREAIKRALMPAAQDDAKPLTEERRPLPVAIDL
jgi:hypothetical protein